jgi:hypothetical protein
MITIGLELRQAAVIRDTLFRSTAQDSYEFPSERTVEIRKAIQELDTQIEEALKNETADS